MTKHQLIGTVASWNGTHYLITSLDAPAHLRTLHLTRTQARSVEVGDRVRLVYTVTPTSGLWSVAEVLAPLAPYRLPDGTVVQVDDRAAKGALVIGYTLVGGQIVNAARIMPEKS